MGLLNFTKLIVIYFIACSSAQSYSFERNYQLFKNELEKMNEELSVSNSRSANISWELSISPNENVSIEAVKFGEIRTEWHNKWCSKLSHSYKILLNDIQYGSVMNKEDNSLVRQFYLLCRGPKYTLHQSR